MELNRKNLRALMLLIVFTLLLYWSFTNLELLGSLLCANALAHGKNVCAARYVSP